MIKKPLLCVAFLVAEVGWVWLARSRFADVARLAGLTLTLGEDASAFYQLGWARHATGEPAARSSQEITVGRRPHR